VENAAATANKKKYFSVQPKLFPQFFLQILNVKNIIALQKSIVTNEKFKSK
jgi:hypothetical protein